MSINSDPIINYTSCSKVNLYLTMLDVWRSLIFPWYRMAWQGFSFWPGIFLFFETRLIVTCLWSLSCSPENAGELLYAAVTLVFPLLFSCLLFSTKRVCVHISLILSTKQYSYLLQGCILVSFLVLIYSRFLTTLWKMYLFSGVHVILIFRYHPVTKIILPITCLKFPM